MKKERDLLLISSILGLLYIILSIFISVLTNNLFSSNTILNIIDIVLYILGLFSSFSFIYFSVSKVNLDNKKILLFMCSLCLFFINIISGILGFIVFSRVNKKTMKELPKLEIQHNYKWYIYLGAFAICMGIIFGLSNLFTKKIHDIIAYIFIILMLIYIFRKDLKRDFKYFKEYFREYSSIVFKTFGISLLILLVLTISIKLYTGLSNATNQIELNKMFTKAPIYVILLALIYAPISEELMFRGIFRKLINNKWIFIITSGVLFGVAHVIDDFKNVKELLFILVYSSIGCFLSSIYYKTNNIFVNIMFHFLQNLLAVIGMILLSFLPDIINLVI